METIAVDCPPVVDVAEAAGDIKKSVDKSVNGNTLDTHVDASKAIPYGVDVTADPALTGYYKVSDFEKLKEWMVRWFPSSTIPATIERSKILVLDLDDTLISYRIGASRDAYWHREGRSISFRPFLKLFLQAMCQYYAAVDIFTSSRAPYAEYVTREINEFIQEEGENYKIRRVFSRDDCIIDNGERRKDLIQTHGMPLSSIVLVDDDPYYSVLSQNNNVLHLPGWEKVNGDTWLIDSIPFLAHLSQCESIEREIEMFKKIWNKHEFVKTATSTMDNSANFPMYY
ncbi:hypothetical protein K7432_015201 [Basidiobolus ranarum]|uniref:Mitochondrial import inner membrane translocase subunit TIM50 n=1 Tax=Basidiobolus ranarum TaxID=34480 RepID=A0ABR2VNE5_9FUNG